MGTTTKQVGIRLEPELISRLDAYAKQREQQTPGQSVTRTDAVKVLLEQGLAEAGFPKESKRKKR
jgi:hypothetical protein